MKLGHKFSTPFIWHIKHIKKKIKYSMKYLLKNLEFPSHSQYNHPLKNELLNHKRCGK